MNETERIIALSDAFGPSGFEDEVAEIVKEELKDIGTLERDSLMNHRMILNPESTGPKVMLDAHMDEVGVIVQAVKPNGTMKFLTLGGWSAPNLPSSAFRLRNGKGEYVKAAVAAKPPHFASAADRNAPVAVDNMVLDCGGISQRETEESFGLGIASPGVPDIKCEYNEAKGLFYGKAFDDRIGVAALIQTLKELHGEKLPCQVQAAFSTQEELGDRGVYANYKALQPDIMICFEGCPADDTFTEPWLIQSAMRKGPMLRNYDVMMLTNPRFQKYVVDLARELNIPVQQSVRSGGGTDAGRIHTEAVPSIVIGIPVRYIHSSSCYCTFEDYRAAVDLAVALCRRLDAETAASF